MEVAVQVSAHRARYEIAPRANETRRVFVFHSDQEERAVGPEGKNLGICEQDIEHVPPRSRRRCSLRRSQSVQGHLQGSNVESVAVQEAPSPKQLNIGAGPADSREDGGCYFVVLRAAVVRERHTEQIELVKVAPLLVTGVIPVIQLDQSKANRDGPGQNSGGPACARL